MKIMRSIICKIIIKWHIYVCINISKSVPYTKLYTKPYTRLLTNLASSSGTGEYWPLVVLYGPRCARSVLPPSSGQFPQYGPRARLVRGYSAHFSGKYFNIPKIFKYDIQYSIFPFYPQIQGNPLMCWNSPL